MGDPAVCWIVVDVETDGPYPPDYSMVCFGAVLLDTALDTTFYGQVCPISAQFDPETLAVSGITRQAHYEFPTPHLTMGRFDAWLRKVAGRRKPVFVSDNPAFDFGWINYYAHRYLGQNPFGWSGRRIGDLFAGMYGDSRARWKRLRKTRHDHHPTNDAKGNAEALLAMAAMGLRIPVLLAATHPTRSGSAPSRRSV